MIFLIAVPELFISEYQPISRRSFPLMPRKDFSLTTPRTIVSMFHPNMYFRIMVSPAGTPRNVLLSKRWSVSASQRSIPLM